MPDLEFNTTEGLTIARELLIAYINTAKTSASPTWTPIGKRVEESDLEQDWGSETIKDVLGNTWTTLQKPTITQSFDPLPLDAGDPAGVKIWNLAIKDQDAQALANQDMLIVHYYAGSDEPSTANFAERYSGCAISVTRLGGTGGGNLEIGFDVTYGGERAIGTVANSGGTVTFTEAE